MRKNSNDTDVIVKKIFEMFLSGSDNPKKNENGNIIIEEGLANYILCVPRFFNEMILRMTPDERKNLIDRYGKIVELIVDNNKGGILFCDDNSRKIRNIEKDYDNISKILSSVRLPSNINIIDFLNLLKMTAREMQYSDNIEISDVNNQTESITKSRTSVATKSRDIINRVEYALDTIYEIQKTAQETAKAKKDSDKVKHEEDAKRAREAEKERYEKQKRLKPKAKTPEQEKQEAIEEYIEAYRVDLNNIISIIDFIYYSRTDRNNGNEIAISAVKKVVSQININELAEYALDILTGSPYDSNIKSVLKELRRDLLPSRYTSAEIAEFSEYVDLMEGVNK